MKKTYFISGATGFIGSALTKRLVEQGNHVISLSNGFRGDTTKFTKLPNVDYIQGDIRDSNIVNQCAEGVDCIVHLAYINGTQNFYSLPELVLDVATRGIINVIDACLKYNIHDLVVASSAEAYQDGSSIPTREDTSLIVPDPLNPRYSYGGGKIITELMALNYGIKYINNVRVFRPHNVFGPPYFGKEHVIPKLISEINNLVDQNPNKSELELTIQGTGKETRSFCYIDDLIDGILLVMNKGQHRNIYHIGSDQETTITDLVFKIGAIHNRYIKVIPSTLQAGSVQRRCPDISKLRKLGYNPKVSLQEGLKITVDWYKSARLEE